MNDNEILSNKAAALALARYPGRPEVARAVSLRIRSQDAPMSVLFGHMIPSQRAADVLVSPEVRQQMVLAKFVDDVASELAAPALNAIPPSPATTEPVAPDSASAPASTPGPVAQQWSLKKPKRFQGYRLVLRDFLKVAWTAGNPEPPTVQDVLDMWETCRPHGITRVMPDGFEYLDAKSKPKEADREAIRKAIERLVIRTTSGR